MSRGEEERDEGQPLIAGRADFPTDDKPPSTTYIVAPPVFSFNAALAARPDAGDPVIGPCGRCGEPAELIELPTAPDWADSDLWCKPCTDHPEPRTR